MKWLFMLLLLLNAVIWLVQLKKTDMSNVDTLFVVDSAVKKIKLLNEKGADTEKGTRCLVFSHSEVGTKLGVLETLLKSKNILFEQVEQKLEMAPSYWVFSESDLSDSLIAELRSVGIDSYVVAEGEWKGRVSLGLFTNIDLAENLIENLSRRDVTAEFIERKKYKTVKWLSIPVNEVHQKEQLLAEIQSLQINVDQIKEIFCKSIASEK